MHPHVQSFVNIVKSGDFLSNRTRPPSLSKIIVSDVMERVYFNFFYDLKVYLEKLSASYCLWHIQYINLKVFHFFIFKHHLNKIVIAKEIKF